MRVTKSMIVIWLRTVHPQSPPLTIGGTVLKESHDLDTLCETFNSKMIFEKHFRLTSRTVSKGLRGTGEHLMIDCSSSDAFVV